MPGAARLGDKAQVAADAHGCPSCPHPAVGPITVGSPDVTINKKPAARLDDIGAHAVCCGPNNFSIVKGSPSVYVNGKPLARLNDKTKHCGGTGPIIEGSPDVLIDDGAGDAAALTAAAIHARKILSEQSKKNEKGKAKKHSDKNPGTGGAGGGGAGAGGTGGTGAGKGAKGPAGTGKGGKAAAGSGDLGKDHAPAKKPAARPGAAKPATAKPAAKPAPAKPGTESAATKPAAEKPASEKPAAEKSGKEKSGKEKSGAQWVARFPTSRSLDDLNDDFRPKAERFIGALRKAGASVSIAATYRPLERAFLMHWCYKVADGSVAPGSVPTMAGVDIDWDHGNAADSKRAAQAMVDGYGIDYPAALTSRHTARAAIDMNVSWSGTLDIVDGDGKTVSIGAPRSGVTNTTLHTVGKSYGVLKLVADHPHWSDNGH